MLNSKLIAFNSRTNHSRDVSKYSKKTNIMNQEFKIKENGFSEISKPIILKIALILATILIVVLGIKSKGFTTKIDTLIVVAPIVIGIFSLIVFLAMKRVKKQFESFVLIINKNEISREQLYIKKTSIPIDKIKSISINERKGLTIQGESSLPQEMILIPKEIEDFEKVKELLSEIYPMK